MKKAMQKQRKTNENIMNFHCKFMHFYLVVIVKYSTYTAMAGFQNLGQNLGKCHHVGG